MSEERLIKLESTLAFQEHTIEKLNEVIVKQQDQIDLLIRKVETLQEKVAEIQPQLVVDQSEEEPPPHY